MVSDGDEMHARGRLAELLARSPVRRRLVALVLRGASRKEIASALRRSPHTIDAHLKAIYRHVGIGDRGRLMLLASRLPDLAPPRNWGLVGELNPEKVPKQCFGQDFCLGMPFQAELRSAEVVFLLEHLLNANGLGASPCNKGRARRILQDAWVRVANHPCELILNPPK